MDDEHREQCREEAEAKVAKGVVRVVRPDDVIAVWVKVRAMLLQDGLVPVVFRPAAVLSTVRALKRGREVGARRA